MTKKNTKTMVILKKNTKPQQSRKTPRLWGSWSSHKTMVKLERTMKPQKLKKTPRPQWLWKTRDHYDEEENQNHNDREKLKTMAIEMNTNTMLIKKNTKPQQSRRTPRPRWSWKTLKPWQSKGQEFIGRRCNSWSVPSLQTHLIKTTNTTNEKNKAPCVHKL